MKRIVFVSVVLLSISILLSCGSSSTRTPSIKNQKLLAPQNTNIYFGAFPDFGGTEELVSKEKIVAFERLVGKKIAWACFSDSWYNGIVYPQEKIDAIRSAGAVPYVRMMPRSDEVQDHAETYFTLTNIIKGKFDANLTKWAQAAKKDGKALLVDFAVEANGNWFGWSGNFNGGSTTTAYGDSKYPDGPERYRDAYRHIIDLFRKEEVSNVTWFYHYNYASFPNEAWNQPKYYYPGDDYIDWIGFSLYGAQTLDEEWEGLEFSTQLQDYYSSFQGLNTKKPIALLEFGVTDFHADGNKSAWLNDAFATILDNPYIKFSAITPWHEDWENEDESFTRIRLDSSSKTLDTAKKWLSDEKFVSQLMFTQ